MKLEYIPKGAKGSPLVLITGNELQSIRTFVEKLYELASGHIEEIAVHDIPGFVSDHGCELYCVRGNTNFGVRKSRSHKGALDWVQTPVGWKESAENAKGFTNAKTLQADAFSYLNRFGKIKVIMSTCGTW